MDFLPLVLVFHRQSNWLILMALLAIIPAIPSLRCVIGGGEETSVTFSIGSFSAGDDYTFFCSFPGHYAIMKGSFKVIA